MVKQNDEKHEAGHKRLRDDYRSLENDFDRLRSDVTDMKATLANIKIIMDRVGQEPIDVGKIMFNPKMVLGIVGLVVTIVSGNWIVNLPVRDSLSVMQTAIANMRTQMDSRGTLEDERHAVVMKQLEDFKKRQELSELEIRNLSQKVH